MSDSIEAVVMCGGMGRRMGHPAMKYGCKSLIPIIGHPALEYVLRVLKAIEFKKIFLCIDRDELASKILEVVKVTNIKNTVIYKDKGFGTMNALYELQGVISQPEILVLFGHHLISSVHLKNIVSCRKQQNQLVVSLYKTSSDDLRKITALGVNSECRYLVKGTECSRLRKNEYYADVPYIVPQQFVSYQSNIPIRSYDAMKSWLDIGNKLIGVKSDFPHEFHKPRDFSLVRPFARKLLSYSLERVRG